MAGCTSTPPASPPAHPQPTRFVDMAGLLTPATLSVLTDELGLVTPTPVQAAVLPLFCGHADVVVDAATGSGKTLAFVVPVIQRLAAARLKPQQVGAVVISPTRELARQTHEVFAPFVRRLEGVVCQLLVGGTEVGRDVAAWEARGGHILVGTPGRLADVLDRLSGAMDLRRLEVLVLDEADRLLDMGFKAHISAIMDRLPKQRRTGLFSATQTEAVEALARAGMRNPVRVNVKVTAASAPAAPLAAPAPPRPGGQEEQKTPLSLGTHYVLCEGPQRVAYLVRFLQAHRQDKVIVYFLTCLCVQYYALVLPRLCQGLAPLALHGRMKQAAREGVLSRFRQQAAGALLCTDVAARGLDIPGVRAVLMADPPQDPDAFVHRAGRTARMGRRGTATVCLAPHEAPYIDFLRLRKVPLAAAEALPGEAVDGSALAAQLRRLSEGDRAVYEAGLRAFVSFVRGYQEHHCQFIFRLPQLDLNQLGRALGLLRLPRMRELRKGRGAADFVASPVDPATIPFRDKARERLRQQQILHGRTNKRDQPEAAQTKVRPQSVQPQKKLPAAKRRLQQDREDYDDLEYEYALLKKLKKGKISEHRYDVATGLILEHSQDNDGSVDTDCVVQTQRVGTDEGTSSRHAAAAPRQHKKGNDESRSRLQVSRGRNKSRHVKRTKRANFKPNNR